MFIRKYFEKSKKEKHIPNWEFLIILNEEQLQVVPCSQSS